MGEWLTRRILRSLAEGGDTAPLDTWHQNAFRAVEESMSATAPNRDTDDMLARVSRTESETQTAYRRIEDTLRAMARRLEQTERSHAENNRAMSKAATEINIATREQSQAFDQLGAHVVGLSDRLSKVERSANVDALRDAVKGLHQGLSRLADQISETARQSTTQIASLAGNVEAVAGKLAETDAGARALEQRLNQFDDRVRPVEHASEATDKLSQRIAAVESDMQGAVTRLEESIARMEARAGNQSSMDRRLQGIEHALSDLMGRLDRAEHNADRDKGLSPQIEDSLRRFSQQLADSEARQRESIAELRASLMETAARVDAATQPPPVVEPISVAKPAVLAQPVFTGAAAPQLKPFVTPAAEPVPQPASQPTATPQFDLPPFPEAAPALQPMQNFALPDGGAFDVPPPPFDGLPGYDVGAPGQEFAPHADAMVSEPLQQPQTPESFLAAARRAARNASHTGARAPANNFTMGSARPGAISAPPAKSSGKTRFVLIAAIVILALGAGMASVLLSQGTARKGALSTPPATTSPSEPEATEPGMTAMPPAADQTTDSDSDSETVTEPQAQEIAPRPVKPVPEQQAKVTPSVPVKAPTLMEILSAKANQGDARAQLALGLKYLEGDGIQANEAEAARWLERAANQGLAVAQYRLGTLYERGHGVPANAAQAIKWYSAAANAGNRKAMHNLAVAYAEGSGGAKDFAQAAQWFAKAASLGLTDSQFNLAVLFERGQGVPQSLVNAYKWYAIAAASGDNDSKARIDALSTQLSAADLATAQKAAASFKPMPVNAAANVPPSASEFAAK